MYFRWYQGYGECGFSGLVVDKGMCDMLDVRCARWRRKIEMMFHAW